MENKLTKEVNVRVAVRVRPLLPKEKLAGEQPCVKLIPNTNQLILGKDRAFTFDHIVSSRTSQEETYRATVDSLVTSCFEGYNATVFAYGQTGSGKTYTIGGDNVTSQTEEDFGIIPRAIRRMYDIMEEHHNRDYTVKVSYIEIYKEELRDLLDLETSSKDLHIREDDKGNTLIVGTSEVECRSQEDVMSCLEQGSSYRHTGSTQMNEHSSRSHSIFTVLIEQHWVEGDATEVQRCRKQSDGSEIIIEDIGEDMEHYICAKFHFVDLAGSERAHRTGNVGDRFKESVHINTGLLALGNVISALGDVRKKVKATHIPYRDSKITRILKDSLGGNAQTLMICCISPAVSSMDESLNALKYANRARNIRNKPIVNRDPHSIRFEEMQTEIKALREELQRQRTSLLTANTDSDVQRAAQDVEHVKEIEDKVVRLQTECAHYRMVAEEAFKQMIDIQARDVLSQSQCLRLRDWLELMEEIKNQVPSTLHREAWENQTICRLESELKQCKNDLRSDEDIFAEKSREVNSLQETIDKLESSIAELTQQLESSEEHIKQQGEQLVEKEVRIEELQSKLKDVEEQMSLGVSHELDMGFEGPPSSARRAKSVPVHMLGDRSARKEVARNIHTSPALFSLERVMQGFRARSQLLASRLEDNDEVLQQQFSEDEAEEDGQSEGEEDVVDAGRNAFERNDKTRSTYKVKKPRTQQAKTTIVHGMEVGGDDLDMSQTDDEKMMHAGTRLIRSKTMTKALRSESHSSRAEVNQLRSSTELQTKKLKKSELEVRQSTQKIRDLSINIKMKEQLIRELVKTGKESKSMNQQYEHRIKSLEQEKQEAQQTLASLQKALHELEHREQQDKAEKERLQSKFREKMEQAKGKIQSLQKKQKETMRMASLTSQNDKRIQELEAAVDKMKQQQDSLSRRLKEEVDRKGKLEREMQKEQQRIKELETRNEQQKKVLKVKTEEVTAMQRKLRSGSQAFLARATLRESQWRDEAGKLEEQRKWLDQEIEKVLEQRQAVDSLHRELSRREEIVAKKEAMLAEKSELEIKKLRSSQLLNKDLHTVSTKLESMDRRIEDKAQEVTGTPREGQGKVKEELKALQHGRERLRKQRVVLDGKLSEGSLLSPQEERRLIELDEAIDALDAAIEYKNESITSRQQEIRKSVLLLRSEDHVMSKLRTLTGEETRTLLTRYFEKVIDLKEIEKKKDLQCSELEMRLEEHQRLVQEMEVSLQRAAMETDRRITHQQQEYEKKIQMLMRQLMEAEAKNGASKDSTAKIQQLEKDMFYYKSRYRELKNKLKEVMAGGTGLPSSAVSSEQTADNGVPYVHVPTPRDAVTKSPRVKSGQSRHSTTTYIINDLGGSGDQTGSATTQSSMSSQGPVNAQGDWDRLSQVRDGATPVRISRKDLRRMSHEEIVLRKSAASLNETPLPADSLDGPTKPWA